MVMPPMTESFFEVEVKLQHRGLSLRSPGVLERRLLGEPALIDENNGSLFLQSFCFELRPLLLFPLGDLRFVALTCLAPGFLRAPPHAPQQPPDFRLACLLAEGFGNQPSYPRQCPKLVVVAMSHRPSAQFLLQNSNIFVAKLWCWTWLGGRLECRGSFVTPCPLPLVGQSAR